MIIIDKLRETDKIKALIFDIDGTITRYKSIPAFLREALNNLGVPYREESLKGWFNAMKLIEHHAITTGEHDKDVYAQLLESCIEDLRKYGVSGYELRDLTFDMEASQTFITPDVPRELKKLASEYILYCYTNWFRSQAIKKLDRYLLRGYFEEIYSPENSCVKFDKTGFSYILEANRLKPQETVHIGDSAVDIIPSKKAGIHPIYIDYNIKSDDDITESKMQLIKTADASITEFQDIRRVLTKRP